MSLKNVDRAIVVAAFKESIKSGLKMACGIFLIAIAVVVVSVAVIWNPAVFLPLFVFVGITALVAFSRFDDFMTEQRRIEQLRKDWPTLSVYTRNSYRQRHNLSGPEWE